MRTLSLAAAQSFAKVVVEDKIATKDSTVYGTAVKFNGKMYVRLDGSERMTPVETTTSIKEGDRVTVLIKAHSATVTGNVSDPSSSTSEKKDTDKKVTDLSSQVTELGTVVAGKVSTDQLQATEARIDSLEADNVTIKGTLEANDADITNLKADNATITGNLQATNAAIDDIKAKMITADTFDAKYATIGSLEATDAKVNNLSSNYADFKQTTTDTLSAQTASINNLAATKLSASDIEGKYANIDFSNIGVAAIKQFYATSGIIKDLVIGDQTVTGELVGVTIKGDLIEGNTIKADKLVVQGTDGLYYKLNISAADGITTEQTAYNSINGSIITANSITAEKIAVHDLVAFDATIAGFKIKDTAIYSTGKESAVSSTRGIYLGKDGQIGFGDNSNYIKFYIDSDGKYKLGISADSLTFSTGQSVKDAISDVSDKISAIKSINTVTIGYLVGDSGTNPPTGTWSAGVPVLPDGKFLWVQTYTTYTDGTFDITYSVSKNGAKGDTGAAGLKALQATRNWTGTFTTVSATATASTNDFNRTPVVGDVFSNLDGSSNTGTWQVTAISGTAVTIKLLSYISSKGAAGRGIKSTVITYQASASATSAPTGTWSASVPSVSAGQYLWTRTIITYTDNTTSTSYSVGRMGTNGNDGKGVSSTVVTYQAAASPTSAPTGTWSSSPVVTSASLPYMWTRTVIAYTDNTTSTSYSVGCTPEGVSVGGRNLATNTNKGTTGWSWSMQAGGYTATAVSENGVNTCKLTRNTVAQSGWSVIQYSYIGRQKWKVNTTYTLSVEVKASVATSMTPGFRHGDGTNALVQSINAVKNATTANTWVKLIWIVKSVATLPSGTAQNTYFTGMNSGTGVWYQFRNLKLEEGNKATDWSPAPEDQVSVGDVTNQLNTELKVTGNSIALTTGHFTINSKNFTLDSSGNAVFSGTVSAATITGGTITGATITGASGEFTKSFKVNIPVPTSLGTGTQNFIAEDGATTMSFILSPDDPGGIEQVISLDPSGIYLSARNGNGDTSIDLSATSEISFQLLRGKSTNYGFNFVNGDVSIDGSLVIGKSSGMSQNDRLYVYGDGIELYHVSGTPYIDFHRSLSDGDYSTRIIADGNDMLSIYGALRTSKGVIPNNKGQRLRMYGGTVVVTSSSNTCGFLSNSVINTALGVSNASNANTVVLASNADGRACSTHFESCTYESGTWYVTYPTTVNGGMRINYLVAYFG